MPLRCVQQEAFGHSPILSPLLFPRQLWYNIRVANRKEETAMAVEKVTSDRFDEAVLKSEKPVLVDFYADWCGPCKMLSPVVEQLAQESDAYRVCKINVDEAPDIASRYGIMSIPTLIVFKNGQVAATSVGVQSKQAIAAMLS